MLDIDLVSVGWISLAALFLYGAFRRQIYAKLSEWRRRRDEFEYSAKYHKDSDLAKSRMEAVSAAREKLQREYAIKAEEAERVRLEKEAQKRAERVAAMENMTVGSGAGPSSGKSKLLRSDYFPLMGDPSSGGYKPPKKSCCKKGGGCG